MSLVNNQGDMDIYNNQTLWVRPQTGDCRQTAASESLQLFKMMKIINMLCMWADPQATNKIPKDETSVGFDWFIKRKASFRQWGIWFLTCRRNCKTKLGLQPLTSLHHCYNTMVPLSALSPSYCWLNSMQSCGRENYHTVHICFNAQLILVFFLPGRKG